MTRPETFFYVSIVLNKERKKKKKKKKIYGPVGNNSK